MVQFSWGDPALNQQARDLPKDVGTLLPPCTLETGCLQIPFKRSRCGCLSCLCAQASLPYADSIEGTLKSI